MKKLIIIILMLVSIFTLVTATVFIPKNVGRLDVVASKEQGTLEVSYTIDDVYPTTVADAWAVDSAGINPSIDLQQMAIWNFTETLSGVNLWLGAGDGFNIKNGSFYYSTLESVTDWLTIPVTGDASTGFEALDINSVVVKKADLTTGTCSLSAGEPHQFFDCNGEALDDVFYNFSFDLTIMTALRLNVSDTTDPAGNFLLGEVDFVVGAEVNLFPSVVFVNQTPDDIDANNVMNRTLDIYYNISDNDIDNTTIILIHNINSTEQGSFRRVVNGTAFLEPEKDIFKSFTDDIYKWELDDSDIYPGSYNVNESVTEREPHLRHQLNTANKAVKLELLNVSNVANISFLEIMVNSSVPSLLEMFYCNSSYTTGNFLTSSNCGLFFTLSSAQQFNHTHNQNGGSVSSHHLIPLNIENKNVSGVVVTNKSFFVLSPTNSNNWDFHYVADKSRATAFENSNNLGGSWTEISGTLDAHLHQFTDNDTFNYQVCANDTASQENCSAWRADAIGLIDLPPSSPDVFNPTDTIFGGNVEINYTRSISSTSTIDFYNISLADTSGTPIATISTNNGLNLNIIWDSNTVADGNYTILVTAIDIKGAFAFGVSSEFTVDNTNPVLTFLSPESNQIFRNDSAIFSFICEDENLFGYNIVVFNSTDFVVAQEVRNLGKTFFQYNNTMDFTNMSDDIYTMSASCIDGHTSSRIEPKSVSVTPNSIEIDSFKIKVDELSAITYEKYTDRYVYNFKTETSKLHKFDITSADFIYYLPKSRYKGHFISGKNWLDFEPYDPVSVFRIDDYHYEVYLSGNDFNFRSIGDVNNVTESRNFEVDRFVDIFLQWDNFTPTNNSNFTNTTNVGFIFNYTNSNNSNAVCTLFRNSTNLTSDLFTPGIRILNDTNVPNFNNTFNYFITCNSFDQAILKNTTIKVMNFENLLPLQIDDALNVTICPDSVQDALILIVFMIITLFFILMGFIFRLGFIGFFGGLFLMVMSWYLAPCIALYAYIVALFSFVLIIWFAVMGLGFNNQTLR